jgi:phosphodiesterase/alkaline phosphatase D-like protein
MTKHDTEAALEFSRRKLLAAAGLGAVSIGGGALVAASLVGSGDAVAAAPTRSPADPMKPPVAGLHLQFGSDASSEVVVSWHTLQTVQTPRVLLGLLDGKLEQTAVAKSVSYTDAKANKVVYAYHAKIGGLKPDTAYLYSAIHDGAKPEFGTFRTAPRGRSAFTFTSFGDQGTPTLGKKFVPPEGVKLASAVFVNDNLGSPAAGDTTLGVEGGGRRVVRFLSLIKI